MSWGKGDPHKDAISIIYMDEAGRLREHTRIDNLVDAENHEEFKDLLRRRRPDVIVVGGFTMATTKLAQRVKEVVNPRPPEDIEGGNNDSQQNEETFNIPVIYVWDEVAKIYQHSKRAAEEFSAFSPVARYCVGLARYAQSPLNEYAAMGPDITTISFDEDYQQLVRIYYPCRAWRFTSILDSAGKIANCPGACFGGYYQQGRRRYQPRSYRRVLSALASVRMWPRTPEGPSFGEEDCLDGKSNLAFLVTWN